jgi:hypothetical protein
MEVSERSQMEQAKQLELSELSHTQQKYVKQCTQKEEEATAAVV